MSKVSKQQSGTGVPARTQVGIVGAGPSGLMLSHLLHLAGIESVVIEQGNREHIGTRLRAGGLEHGSVALMERAGLGERMRSMGLTVTGTDFRFDGIGHRVDFQEITGRSFLIYPQYEIIADLLNARHAAGGQLLFESPVHRIEGVEGEQQTIVFESGGQPRRLVCDFVAGCDGYHGPTRRSLPPDAVKVYEHTYPFGWLGVLADVPPPTLEVSYSYHERGFAMGSFRTPTVRRMYLQCAPDDRPADWSDDRIWSELRCRLDVPDRPPVAEGPITHKSVTAMKNFIVEPMQFRRVFLAGDAAHIVPPTGAKGLNSALADVAVLANAFEHYYRKGRREQLDSYSNICLERNWRVQKFSADLCTLFHRFPDADAFTQQMHRVGRQLLAGSDNGRRWYAENFVGLPFGVE